MSNGGTVAFDARRCGDGATGVGIYAQCLLQALVNEPRVKLFVIHAPGFELRQAAGSAVGEAVVPCMRVPFSPESHPLTEIWERYVLPLRLRAGDARVFHSPAFLLPPLPPTVRTVVTCHDLAVFRVPESFPARFVWYLRRGMIKALARADRIIVDTRYMADELIHTFSISPTRIVVIPCGVPPLTTAAGPPADLSELGIDGNYLLHVGTLEPRKNLPRLVRVFGRLRRRGWDGKLVLVGRAGYKSQLVSREAASLGAAVVHPGYVSRAQLEQLYRGATAVVMPSLYEGFGLPVLEALSLGVPVCASAIPSLCEVGGDAVQYFAPTNEADMEGVLWSVLSDTTARAQLVEAGRERAAAFTWKRAAELAADLYRDLLRP